MSTDSMAEKRRRSEPIDCWLDKLDIGLVRGDAVGEGVICCDPLRKEALIGRVLITLYPGP